MKKYTLLYILGAGLLSACDLLEPADVVNPNVVEEDFTSTPDAMQTWVNGTNACFGTCISKFAELTGLLSDDLYNNSSRSAKTFDVLDVLYTDTEVANLATQVGKMIEMADFGLESVAAADASTTPAMQFNLCYIKAVAYLLGAENFVALPKEARGQVLTSKEQAAEAVSVLETAGTYATSDSDKALLALLKARAYRLSGDAANAQTEAAKALSLNNSLLLQVQFDAMNGFVNTLQEYVSTQLFTILPRLEKQAVKCPLSGLSEQPIAVAKIEEAHLILAETNLSAGNLTAAQGHLNNLLNAVAARNDSSVTTLTVTAADIAAATTADALYELIYTMRQETFFGEGRRSADMGIRLPLSEVEYVTQGNLPESYTQVFIPAYLDSIKSDIDLRTDLNARMTSAKADIFPFE